MATTELVFLFGEGDPEALAEEVWDAFGAADDRDRYAGDGQTYPGTDTFGVGVDYHSHEDHEFWADLRPDIDGQTLVTPPESTTVTLTIFQDPLYNSDPGDEQDLLADKLATGVAGVYEGFDTAPLFTYGMAPTMQTAVIEDTSPPPVGPDGELRFATWIMMFPPAKVAEFGRERLLDAPVWRVEELADGAVMLIATKSPDEVYGPLDEVRRELQKYLGLDPDALPY